MILELKGNEKQKNAPGALEFRRPAMKACPPPPPPPPPKKRDKKHNPAPQKKELRFEQSPPSTLTRRLRLQNSHRPFWTLSKTDWRDALAGYWRDPLRLLAGCLAESRDTQRDTGRDPLALGWSAGHPAGSTGGLLWWDTWRDPVTCCGILSGILGGIHWRAALGRDPLASYSGRILGGILGGIQLASRSGGTRRDPLASSYSVGSTGEQIWRDNAGYSAALAGASCSGGILGGGVV